VTTASPSLGRRNMILNGSMAVAQRGTSETGVTTSDVYVVDRFSNNVVDTAEFTISQSTTAPTGFASSLKWENTTANASPTSGQYASINQKIEAQNLQHLKYGTSDAQSVTLSFWVRSNKTGTYIIELLQPDATNRHINKSYTINSADTWEQKTITFEGDTSGVINNDNGIGLIVAWWLNAGSGFSSGTLQTSWGALDQTARAVGQVNLADTIGNDFYLTGVQLEVGSVATPFEHRSYGEELQSCLRYFWKITGGTSNKDNFAIGTTWSSTQIFSQIHFPVPMRAEASTGDITEFDIQAIVAGNGYNVSFDSFSDMHEYGGRVTFNVDTGTPFTAGQAILVRTADSASSFIAFDAEL